jgi:hypothetical protein
VNSSCCSAAKAICCSITLLICVSFLFLHSFIYLVITPTAYSISRCNITQFRAHRLKQPCDRHFLLPDLDDGSPTALYSVDCFAQIPQKFGCCCAPWLQQSNIFWLLLSSPPLRQASHPCQSSCPKVKQKSTFKHVGTLIRCI